MPTVPVTEKRRRTRDEMRLSPEQQAVAVANIRLVRWGEVFILRRYPHIHPDDASSIAAEALVLAVNGHDPKKGKLTTHFTWQLRARLGRWFYSNTPQGYRHGLGGEPPKILHLGDGSDRPEPSCEDPPHGDDPASILNAILGRPDPEDAELLRAYHLGGLVLREVGDCLGVCRERARQRIEIALTNARKAAESLGLVGP
jgi:hypothetical protein